MRRRVMPLPISPMPQFEEDEDDEKKLLWEFWNTNTKFILGTLHYLPVIIIYEPPMIFWVKTKTIIIFYQPYQCMLYIFV